MEEVDKIIIHTLTTLGCEFNGITTIGQFGVTEVVNGVVRCLNIIDPSSELSPSLPQNMAQRFRSTGTIANAVKNLGYSADLGYQSLLYPNDVDLRKIFMFLIEKLPKDTATVTNEQLGLKASIQNEARNKLKVALNRPWVPPYCRKVAFKRRSRVGCSVTSYGTFHCKSFQSLPFYWLGATNCDNLDLTKQNCDNSKPSFLEYSNKVQLLPATLLNAHATQLAKDKFNSSDLIDKKEVPEFTLEPLEAYNISTITEDSIQSDIITDANSTTRSIIHKETEEELAKRVEESIKAKEETKIKEREERLDSLKLEINELTENIKAMKLNIETNKDSLDKIKIAIEQENEQHEILKKDYKTKHRISTLIPDAPSNVERLQVALKNSEEKMIKLQKQWSEHKDPLEQQIKDLKQKSDNSKNNKQAIIDELTDLRDKMKIMVQDASKKEAAFTQLKQQHDAMNKDINRSAYTKKIYEISAKVLLQKKEINKVISDTKIVQKEINVLIGKLERTFAVAESTAYQEASSNEKARPIYRAVVAVHEGCGGMVEIVRETGAVQREMSDLQEQLNFEKNKKIEDRLTQLVTDLNNVKKENAAIKQKIIKNTH